MQTFDARLANGLCPHEKTFSIATLVTDPDQYARSLASFRAKGFTDDICEYLYIDNSSSNQYDAYSGLNHLLSLSKGKYVILCHQDVELAYDDRKALAQQIELIETLDPSWAVLGNAGGVNLALKSVRISDPNHDNARVGPIPGRVTSLDENFLVVKSSANLGFSSDLSGFHMYGSDLVQQARFRGYSSYTIDFHLHHHSGGTIDKSFHIARREFLRKYVNLKQAQWIHTSCTILYISSNALLNRALNIRRIYKLCRSIAKRVQTCKPKAPKLNPETK